MKKFTELYYNKSKKSGMSIAYAIVSLVIAAVAIVALTPVLTRKLPNLATSSAIKHPKGWYESYNAPDEGVYYCEKCRIADECAAIRRAGGNCCKKLKNKFNLSCNEDSDDIPDTWPTTPEYVKIESTDNPDNTPSGCYGNPSCLPFIKPGTSPDKIRAFDRYCKPNGTCLPPQPCEQGACRFKPPKGVTKYVVYAIGGGGGSGSAVASNTSGHLWSDISGNYKKIVGGRNNYDGVDKYSEYTPIILPKGADTPNENLDDSDNIVDSHFIDMNRKNTAGTAYKPENFVNDQSNSNNLYPNRLESSIKNPECATGILYTVGDESRNFHIYPTEDADDRLAKDISDKQVKRILKELGESENKTYKIGGSLNFHYYDRYYLYTHELGVYGYNQNPVYSLMPEWIKLKPGEKKYPTDADFHKYVDGTDTSTYCNNKTCDINYYSSGTCGSINNNKVIVPITSKYKTVAAVACSGNGGKGGDAVAMLKAGTDEPCDWMKPQGCVFDQETYNKERKLLKTGTLSNESCDNEPGSVDEPPEGTTSITLGQYCRSTGDYDTFCDKYDDKDKSKCLTCTYTFNDVYYNMICKFKTYTTGYVKCKCDSIDLGAACVTDQNKLDGKCRNLVLEPPLDMNNANDMKRLEEKMSEDMAADGSSTVVINVPGVGQLKYRVDTNGKIYDISGAIKRSQAPDSFDGIGRQVAVMDSTISQDPRTGKYYLSPGERIHFLALIKDDADYWKDKNAEDISYISTTSGAGANSNLSCELRRNYVRYAYGGRAGIGICVYKTASIRPNTITSINVSPLSGFSKSMPQRPQAAGCDKHNDGASADNAYACINSNCGTATGGEGSGGGEVYCPICSGGSKNGDNGADGTATGGGSFSRGQTGALQYQENAYMTTTGGDPAPGGTVGANITGTQKTPGIYNFRYIWYMPFVTKHLMFGTAGSSGEELIVTVTLSEDQTLETMPGKGANKTNYKSGTNGLNGGDSLIRKTEIDSPQNINNFRDRANYVAHGGKGGIGNQKTDEYLLCHRSDLQGTDPKLPCYAKRIGGKIVTNKKTHYYENGKFKGIQAIKPKVGEKGMTVKMSEALKGSNPGIGAMGFGTESVSDFICEERHIDKLDQVNSGYARKTVISSSGIGPDGAIDDKCKGNSKIRYILPNAKDYASSTGAVIIMW